MATDTGTRGSRTTAESPSALTRRQLPRWAPAGVLALALALAYGLTTVLTAEEFSYPLLVVALIVFNVAIIWALSRAVEGGRRALDRAVTAVVSAAFGIALLPLVSVVWTVISRGAARFDAEFFTNSMQGVVGEGGGIYHALFGTLLVTLATAVISVPIGIMAAIYLVEYGRGALARAITFFVDVMTGIPSIVAGLFAYALFVLFFGPGVRLGIMGAIALSVLMIPVVVRSTEEMLKLVPNELREASYALGVPQWRTIAKVVLPTSIAGIATGVTISIARVIGETAPLLVTLGITSATNFNLFEGRVATLPVFSYYQYATPGVPPEPYLDRAWSAALLLIVIVMVLNLVARLISRLFAPRTR